MIGDGDDRADRAAENLRLTFDLCAAGEAIKRQQLRREHPDASDEVIEGLLIAWLQDRPGAPFGDAEGRPVPWPRPPR
jgi:hypothetical protein